MARAKAPRRRPTKRSWQVIPSRRGISTSRAGFLDLPENIQTRIINLAIFDHDRKAVFLPRALPRKVEPGTDDADITWVDTHPPQVIDAWKEQQQIIKDDHMRGNRRKVSGITPYFHGGHNCTRHWIKLQHPEGPDESAASGTFVSEEEDLAAATFHAVELSPEELVLLSDDQILEILDEADAESESGQSGPPAFPSTPRPSLADQPAHDPGPIPLSLANTPRSRRSQNSSSIALEIFDDDIEDSESMSSDVDSDATESSIENVEEHVSNGDPAGQMQVEMEHDDHNQNAIDADRPMQDDLDHDSDEEPVVNEEPDNAEVHEKAEPCQPDDPKPCSDVNCNICCDREDQIGEWKDENKNVFTVFEHDDADDDDHYDSEERIGILYDLNEPDIMLASKEIRKKCLPIYYSRNAFSWRFLWADYQRSCQRFKSWTEAVGREHIQLITKITFQGKHFVEEGSEYSVDIDLTNEHPFFKIETFTDEFHDMCNVSKIIKDELAEYCWLMTLDGLCHPKFTPGFLCKLASIFIQGMHRDGSGAMADGAVECKDALSSIPNAHDADPNKTSATQSVISRRRKTLAGI